MGKVRKINKKIKKNQKKQTGSHGNDEETKLNGVCSDTRRMYSEEPVLHHSCIIHPVNNAALTHDAFLVCTKKIVKFHDGAGLSPRPVISSSFQTDIGKQGLAFCC